MLKRRRLTMQAFGHAAIMRALNEIELGKRTDEEIAKDARQEQKKGAKGFGIRDQLIEDRNRETERADLDREREERVAHENKRHIAATVAAPSLTPTTIDSDILALARTVVETPKGERATVLRSACRALAPRARTEEEAKYLVDQLYDAVKRLDGVPVSALERVRARMGR
jgi:hypothetical protein